MSRPHISLCFTWGQAQGPESQISCCPERAWFLFHPSCAHIENREEERKSQKGGREKERGVLGTLAWCCPPLSVTVPEHCSAHHSGLHLQLLHFLQKRFLAGVLGPVSKEKTRRTWHVNSAVTTGCSPMGPLWCPLTQAGAWRHCGTYASPVHGEDSTSATWEAPQVLQDGSRPWVSANDPLRALLVAAELADALQVQIEAQRSCRVTGLPWKLSTSGPKDPKDALILTQVDICGFFGLCPTVRSRAQGKQSSLSF